MVEKIHVWHVMPMKDSLIQRIRERFEVHFTATGPTPAALEKVRHLPIRAVISNGSHGLSGACMEALPNLEIIACAGAGFENVDLPAANARRVLVTNSPGVNDAPVADLALGLMLAISRGIAELDRVVRAGQWKAARLERPTISAKRVGILGLGNIGRAIAKRCEAFDMSVAYHSRNRRPDVGWTYHPTLIGLARAVDFLVVACPGGSATRHLVNAEVLEALGPTGYLVNIARGSVVDTEALIEALRTNRIAGAGLDVVEGEPDVPAGLLTLENLVITPHIGGRSPESVQAQVDSILANLEGHFRGRGAVTPVPGSVSNR